jgi:hypothetical protein
MKKRGPSLNPRKQGVYSVPISAKEMTNKSVYIHT